MTADTLTPPEQVEPAPGQDAAVEGAPGPTDWSLVVLLGALTAFGALSTDMYLPALPAIEHGFHARSGAGQMTLASFFAGLAIGQFGHGPASDRWGRRGPLFLGVGLYVAASVACALAPSLEMLAIARFVQGVGACSGSVIGRAIARDRFDHRGAARVLSQLMLVMGLAPILAPMLGGVLLIVADWRAIFWVFVVFGAFIGLWMFAALPETRSAETAAKARGEHPIAGYLSLLKMPSLVGYTLAGAFNSAALFGYIAAAPGLLIQAYHIAPTLFGAVFGINGVGLIAMSQLNAHLLRRHTPEYILVRARPLTLIFAVVLAIDAYANLFGLWGVLVPLFMVVGSFGLVGANTQAAGLSCDPQRAGSISALMGGAGFGAGALVSSLTAAFADGTARPMAATVLGSILASTLALYGLARPASRRV
ncbi:MAG TPA: multidrug effflux MFS transporter [Caulobacteraceae bacterium]|nr:multidrug effflux MFS transporter [Caulobacteraceae bacterium]